MDFEDDNPFDLVPSETSSASRIDLSAPPSPPASRPFPSHGTHKLPQLAKTEFCCRRDRFLHADDHPEIVIVDAQKTSANAAAPYITYVIAAGDARASHRYSEFESLRDSLARLYPTLIIPPIPSKHSISDYAVKQAKAKEDTAMIASRRRMLQTFLNRLATHPILSNEHVFHRFLDGEVSWHEVLNSSPLSVLPKNILKAPSHNPVDPNASPAYAALPNPSAAHPLRNPDQRFLDSEAFTLKFASHIGGPMEKVTRRVIRRWSDYARDHADLGAALNGFSLNESDEMAVAVEKTGQAVDATFISTTQLVQELEQNWAEPLHEYSQFASIIKKLLAYRHQKHAQFEMTQDGLESKREQLEELEKSEKEARRLEEALGRAKGAASLSPSPPVSTAYGNDAEAASPSEWDEAEKPEPPEPATATESTAEATDPQPSHSEDAPLSESPTAPSHLPPHPGPSPVKRRTRAPGMGFLNALSYTLHGMMDVDPETARRNGITKTRETIAQLEEALHLSAEDLKYSSTAIQSDLDRFQRQKVADLREMCINMAKSHRDWAKKNLESWEEAKKEIEKIADHPSQPQSQPPVREGESSGSGEEKAARRDSTATVNGR